MNLLMPQFLSFVIWAWVLLFMMNVQFRDRIRSENSTSFEPLACAKTIESHFQWICPQDSILLLSALNSFHQLHQK